jgi:4-amino-4-deoxy-L-arabinose transferase-like glycosyltransferase
MYPPPHATRRLSWAWFLIPIVFAAFFRELWAPDEPRYAMVAKWMFDHGEFLVLRRCGELYPDKPPLAYWLSGFLGWLSGWSVEAMRLVSIAATAGTAWFTSRMAAQWLGPREAHWAPLLFVGFALILWNGARIALDPLLTLGCVGGLYYSTVPARDTREANRSLLLAGAMVSIGMLAKGPVALVNVGLPLLAWRFLGLGPQRARASRLAAVGAIALAIAPVASWAVAASLREPALWRHLFFGQHLERAAKGTAHAGPPWQNLLQVPLLVLPWAVPVLFGCVDGFRAWREQRRGVASQAGLARLWWWAAVLFVFFSLIPAKRELYLMSAYPAFAMLGAQRLVRALDSGRVGGKSAAVPLALFALVGIALVIGAPAANAFWPRTAELVDDQHEFQRLLHDFPSLPWRGAAAGAVFVVGAALSWRAWRARRMTAWANGVALTWACGVSAAMALLGPVIDVLKSDRELAAQVGALIEAHPEPPREIPCYGTHPEGPRFYGAGPCVGADPAELLDGSFEQRAAREGPNFIALVRESLWERRPAAPHPRYSVVARIRVGSRPLVLVGAPALPRHARHARQNELEARAAELR